MWLLFFGILYNVCVASTVCTPQKPSTHPPPHPTHPPVHTTPLVPTHKLFFVTLFWATNSPHSFTHSSFHNSIHHILYLSVYLYLSLLFFFIIIFYFFCRLIDTVVVNVLGQLLLVPHRQHIFFSVCWLSICKP